MISDLELKYDYLWENYSTIQNQDLVVKLVRWDGIELAAKTRYASSSTPLHASSDSESNALELVSIGYRKYIVYLGTSDLR